VWYAVSIMVKILTFLYSHTHITTQSINKDTVSLDRGLIDSAFMVWNQYSPHCPDFTARLACTWSSEIQCGSDRDQIAFPRVLQKLGLKESLESQNVNNVEQSLYLVNDSGTTMVHILKSACHWYFRSFPKLCTISLNELRETWNAKWWGCNSVRIENVCNEETTWLVLYCS